MGTVNVVQVAAGDQHGLALTNGSKLYAWGKNEFGQCGLGPKASKVVSTPQVFQFEQLSITESLLTFDFML